jgi:hypothetical protein
VRRAAATLAVALLALPLASCSHGGGDSYVLQVDGVADVTAPGPVQHLTTGRHRLHVGQTVTVTRGSAVLGLPGDTSLELRAGRRDSTVQVDARPTLVDGDALAVAGGGDDLTVSAGGARFDLHDGAARIRRSAGVTIAVYRGEAGVESAGTRLASPVRALRQATISDSGVLPRRAVPLVYDREDPDHWDTRYLNDAIDLGTQLERRVRVLNARPAPPAVDAEYLQAVVPALRSASGFTGKLLSAASSSVGETIVGASIALGGRGDLADRWEHAFTFRQQGADWGLVALDQRARRASVLGVLNGVLDRVVTRVSPVSTGGRVGGGSSSSPAGGAVAPAGGSTSPTTTTPPPQDGGPAAPAVPTTPLSPLLPPITVPLLPTQPTSPVAPQPVQGLLDGILGTGGSSSGSVVGGVLDTVGGLLGGG